MLFVLCLFYKIVVSCIAKCVTEPLTKYIVLYEINNCNSVILGMESYNKKGFFLDNNRLVRQVIQSSLAVVMT